MLDKLQYPTETIIVFEIADEQAMDVLHDHTMDEPDGPIGGRLSTIFNRIAIAAFGNADKTAEAVFHYLYADAQC